MGTLTNDTTRSQLAAIREHLLTYGKIDKPTALEICDCDRLGARIWDIRNDAVDPLDIVTEIQTKTNRFGHPVRYAVYRLAKEETA